MTLKQRESHLSCLLFLTPILNSASWLIQYGREIDFPGTNMGKHIPLRLLQMKNLKPGKGMFEQLIKKLASCYD